MRGRYTDTPRARRAYQVRVHDTNTAVLDRRSLPDIVNGLAIVGSTIVVTSGSRLWRMPVR